MQLLKNSMRARVGNITETTPPCELANINFLLGIGA